MKDYYKINEIAKLYGIGVDSLRYYERLGILKPRRDTNGYRLYSLKEMYKLNMIRDLRRLNFSMEQIKAYLEGQTVDNTLHLLRQEADLVQEQLRELQAKAVLLEKRVATLEAARRVVPGVVARKTLPPRPCVLFTEHITRDEEMDFVMKKLHRQHEDKIRDFGNQIFGAFLLWGMVAACRYVSSVLQEKADLLALGDRQPELAEIVPEAEQDTTTG